jgi:hypothetical protein
MPRGFLTILTAFFILVFSFLLPLCGQAFEELAVEEQLDITQFYIAPKNNFAGAAWVHELTTDKIIGYAACDAQIRRWTLFNLKGEYRGYIQATVGTTSPPHYRQYLWYDRDNRYKGVFIVRLGGRPVTPDLPSGELGGQLDVYERGDIPIPWPSYEVEPDPLRRLPIGRSAGQ